MCHFDANLLSEPLSIMNLLWDFAQTNDKYKWCKFYGIHTTRIKRLDGTCNNLRQRVADFFGLDANILKVTAPPYLFDHSVITILRIIQVWVFHETIIQCDPQNCKAGISENDFTLLLGKKSDRIEQKHLEQVLMKDRHVYALRGDIEFVQQGTFEIVGDLGILCGMTFQKDFECKLLSYSTEKNLDLVWITFDDAFAVYFRSRFAVEPSFSDTLLFLSQNMQRRTIMEAVQNSSSRRRGQAERPCGLWDICDKKIDSIVENTSSKYWVKFDLNFTNGKKKRNVNEKFLKFLRSSSSKAISLEFPWQIQSLKECQAVKFRLVSYGCDKQVNFQDLKDLLSPRVQQNHETSSFGQQKIVFPLIDNAPVLIRKNGKKFSCGGSWDRPLFKCIPEGARLLSVLASGRRKEHFIRLSIVGDAITPTKDNDKNAFLDIYLDSSTKISYRWKRFNTDTTVYVSENSVAASAIPTQGSNILYCICANTLEVRGGSLRAEGLTLLPLGKLFLILCRFTFGLFHQTNLSDGSLTEKAIRWIDNECDEVTKAGWAMRIDKAAHFNQSSNHLGTNLECFPEMVRELLSIFDGIDSHDYKVWSSLLSDPFVPENLSKHRKAFKVRQFQRSESSTLSLFGESFERETNEVLNSATIAHPPNAGRKTSIEADNSVASLRFKAESEIENKHMSKTLFATSLSSGEIPGDNDLPSSNILALCIENARRIVNAKDEQKMTVDSTEWEITTFPLESRTWFRAVFKPADIPYVKRTSKNDPAWLKHDDPAKARPSTIFVAQSCIPPTVEMHAKVVKVAGNPILVFASLEHAIQMESAFWLERQFKVGKKHWYQQHDISAMARQLAGLMKKYCKAKNKTKSKQSSTKKMNNQK